MPLHRNRTEKVKRRETFATTGQWRLNRHLDTLAWCMYDTAQEGTPACRAHRWCQKCAAAFSTAWNHLTWQNDWFGAGCWHGAGHECQVHTPCARALGSCENNAPQSNCKRAKLLFQKHKLWYWTRDIFLKAASHIWTGHVLLQKNIWQGLLTPLLLSICVRKVFLLFAK